MKKQDRNVVTFVQQQILPSLRMGNGLKYKKPTTIEFRLVVGFAGAVFVVLCIGILAWFSMNKIVSDVEESAKPDGRIIAIKEIVSGISEAEGYIKSYTITNDPKYLTPYYKLFSTIDKAVFHLKKMNAKDPSHSMVDSLAALIQMKFIALNQFVNLRDTGRMDAILENLSERANPNGISGLQKAEEQKGFLYRLFNKKRKNTQRSAVPSAASKDMLTEIEVMRFMEAQDAEVREKLLLEITARDLQIMAHIRNLVSAMEANYQKGIMVQTKHSEVLAGRANTLIGIFVVIVSLLLALMSYVITGYIKKNREITRQLSIAKSNTEKLANAKEMFLANMAHEIRTPLHAIIGFAGQLLDEGYREHESEQIGIIKKSSEHLLKLINNILDIAKLDAGKLVRVNEAFSPAEAIQDSLIIVKAMAIEKNIELEFIAPDKPIPDVEGDLTSLKQILINLLSNAVKFTDVGGVKLHLNRVKGSDKSKILLEITIEDSGAGVSAEKLPYIFEEFEQAGDMTDSRFSGTGLGLSIAKKLVDFLNGSIEMKSKEGEGSQVIVRLPFARARKSENYQTKQLRGKMFSKLRFLIADDEPYNVKLVYSMLKKWGARSDMINSGAMALQCLENNAYDILLLDLKMPVMSGFEVAKELRRQKDNQNSNIPIIALTASTADEVRDECGRSGIELVLTKPFSEEGLVGLLGELFPDLTLGLPETEEIVPQRKEHDLQFNSSYNLKNLYRIAGGDEAFVQEMIETFVESTGKNLSKLILSSNLSDWIEVERLVHTMIPPCRHMGLDKVANVLKDIENLVSQNETEMIEELTSLVYLELGVQMEALQREIVKPQLKG